MELPVTAASGKLAHVHTSLPRAAFGIGRPAPPVDGYLARLTRLRTMAGGDASGASLLLLSLSLLSGSGFGFCGTTVTVVLARSPGCPSRHDSEPARSQEFPIPVDNFPNVELACVCDSVGKSPAWRGLDAAFPSHCCMHCDLRHSA